MNKHMVRIAALILLPCLFTEQLAEPVFSDVLVPVWQFQSGGFRSPLRMNQDVLGGIPGANSPGDLLASEFRPGSSAWTRWVGKAMRPLRKELRAPFDEMAAVGDRVLASPPRWTWPLSPVRMNGWVANFHPSMTARALRKYSPQLDELSVFGVGATMQGRLAPESDFIAAALRAVHLLKNRPRVYLTVANIRPQGVHDHWLLDHWLGSRKAQKRHIWDLLRVARKVDGLDLDYENLRPGDGPRFGRFVIALADELHARHKLLALTVEHQTFTHADIDWSKIAGHVDRIRVMAYQYHYTKTSPGAVSPPDLVQNLARCALTQIPVDKLEIALPMYGFDWTRKGDGALVGTVGDYRRLARQPASWEFRDPETHSARIDYFLSSGKGKRRRVVRHQVWYEDAASIAHKIQMLQQLGIRHVGLWQMAVGDLSELFSEIHSKQSGR